MSDVVCTLAYESANTTASIPCRHLEQAPLFGLTEDDQWSNVVVGWACVDCGEQWFQPPRARR